MRTFAFAPWGVFLQPGSQLSSCDSRAREALRGLRQCSVTCGYCCRTGSLAPGASLFCSLSRKLYNTSPSSSKKGNWSMEILMKHLKWWIKFLKVKLSEKNDERGSNPGLPSCYTDGVCFPEGPETEAQSG